VQPCSGNTQLAALQCGRRDPDIWYTAAPSCDGRPARRNEECVSLFADNTRCLGGRTPMECYTDMMIAFATAMPDVLGTVIVEVIVGMGPCGELRFPSYTDSQGWRFPGVRNKAQGGTPGWSGPSTIIAQARDECAPCTVAVADVGHGR
jgi:Glycosyl hydrolase family 14